MMEWRRREPAPTWYLASYEHVLDSGLSLEIRQDELDEMRAERELGPVRMAPPDLTGRNQEGDC